MEENSEAPKDSSKAKGSTGETQYVRVNVKNLSPSCTADELRGLFEDAGAITQAQVKTTPDSNGNRMGFVCYATLAEAEKAVTDMNGKVEEERTLSVKIVDRLNGKGEGGKSKGKGKQKAAMVAQHASPYWYGADRMQTMGYPAGFYEYSMMNPYGYDLGALYNAMYGQPTMFNGFSMAMPGETSGTKGMGRDIPDPNTIAALQQAQLFALQSQVAAASKEEAKGKAKGKGKVKGKGKEKSSSSAPVVTADAPAPDKEFVGALKSLSGKNGYGFIQCTEIQELFHRDVWVDSALLPEGADPDERTQLKFNVTLSAKGHPQAKDVKLA